MLFIHYIIFPFLCVSLPNPGQGLPVGAPTATVAMPSQQQSTSNAPFHLYLAMQCPSSGCTITIPDSSAFGQRVTPTPNEHSQHLLSLQNGPIERTPDWQPLHYSECAADDKSVPQLPQIVPTSCRSRWLGRQLVWWSAYLHTVMFISNTSQGQQPHAPG